MTLQNWREEYRHMFEGANSSSISIENQIYFIESLLSLQQQELEKDLEGARELISYQERSIATDAIDALYNKYCNPELAKE